MLLGGDFLDLGQLEGWRQRGGAASKGTGTVKSAGNPITPARSFHVGELEKHLLEEA